MENSKLIEIFTKINEDRLRMTITSIIYLIALVAVMIKFDVDWIYIIITLHSFPLLSLYLPVKFVDKYM